MNSRPKDQRKTFFTFMARRIPFFCLRVKGGRGAPRAGKEKGVRLREGTPEREKAGRSPAFQAMLRTTRSRWAWAGQPFCRRLCRGRRGTVRTLLSACSRCSWTECGPWERYRSSCSSPAGSPGSSDGQR